MCYKGARHSRRGRHHHHWHHAKRHWKQRMAAHWETPPVNIEEFDDRYELLVYAAGYTKSDFKVALRDDTLIIGAKKPREEEGTTHWRRREFRPQGFERQFELNDRVDKEAISAKYEDGILKVTVGKLAGFETQRQDIDIV